MNDKMSLHTHCFRCKHSQGNATDYAKAAVERGMKVLGMSDHVPLPDDWWPGIRMHISEMEDYLAEIEAARAAYPMLKILSGFECDYFPEYEEFFRYLSKRTDYLIGSVHAVMWRGRKTSVYEIPHTAKALYTYADLYCQAMASGLFRFMAHPDLFSILIDRWDSDCDAISKQIMEAALKCDATIEINANGFRRALRELDRAMHYPIPEFWAWAGEYGVKVVVNSDAHFPHEVNADMDLGFQMVGKFGLRLDPDLSPDML